MADKEDKKADEKNLAEISDQKSAEEPKNKTDSKKDGEGTSSNDPARTPDKGNMWIKVYSPYQVYYDSQAQSISAVNETGPFDILAQHHKFLTLLEPCEMSIISDSDEEKIKIARGVMYVKEDRVTVFLDI